MKKTIICIITSLVLSAGNTALASARFTDVAPDSWYFSSVESAVSKGIINGNGDGTFNPEGKLTVAEAVTISAKINASYFLKTMPSASEDSTHWADEFFAYLIDNGIIGKDSFLPEEYDRPIKRGEMFDIFAGILPETEYSAINNILAIPEPTESASVEKLFCSGIVTGSDSGFETDKDITRAETAAICVRVVDHEKRIIIESDNTPGETETENTNPSLTDQSDTQSEINGTADNSVPVEPLIYTIPLTFWDEGDNLTGAPKITSGEENGIITRFGNHTYGTETQTQYEYLMEALDEAYKYTAGEESQSVKDPYSAYNTYKAGRITQEKLENNFKRLLRNDKTMKVLFDENLEIKDDTIYSNFYRAYQTGKEMMKYITEEYIEPNKKLDVGGPDGINDNVFLYLAKKGSLDYEGWANMQMAIYDYLGFSTRAVETVEGKCRGVQILMCGEWICTELMSRDLCLINATAEQLRLYCESNGKTGSGEKDYLKGTKNDGAVTDLKVIIPATHLPGNYDYDAK